MLNSFLFIARYCVIFIFCLKFCWSIILLQRSIFFSKCCCLGILESQQERSSGPFCLHFMCCRKINITHNRTKIIILFKGSLWSVTVTTVSIMSSSFPGLSIAQNLRLLCMIKWNTSYGLFKQLFYLIERGLLNVWKLSKNKQICIHFFFFFFFWYRRRIGKPINQ